jgi:hypothetical protein
MFRLVFCDMTFSFITEANIKKTESIYSLFPRTSSWALFVIMYWFINADYVIDLSTLKTRHGTILSGHLLTELRSEKGAAISTLGSYLICEIPLDNASCERFTWAEERIRMTVRIRAAEPRTRAVRQGISLNRTYWQLWRIRSSCWNFVRS